MAIVIALMSMLLMSALGAALVMMTSIETAIAANFRDAQAGFYAADAALERALDELGAVGDWSSILAGATQSASVDGPPTGIRVLADGSGLDLGRTVNMLNCRKATTCSASELVANTSQRPWGANNPTWRLFAYGPLAALLGAPLIESPYYVLVMVADDPSENDGDPLRDGSGETNPGTGVLVLRGEAFGPRGTHQVVELTVTRPGMEQEGVRVLSWRRIARAP